MGEAAIETKRAKGGAPAFLGEAAAGLRRRALVGPVLLLLVVLTVSNIVILQNLPASRGAMPPPAFLAAALVRVAGLLLLAVGMLRILTDSPRPRWRPDGGFWLYLLTFLVGGAVSVGIGALIGDRGETANLILSNLLTTLVSAPFAVWFVAIAVARPLAWRPRPWFRDFRTWLPFLLLWTLLLVSPMAILHAAIDLRLVRGAGEAFWPLALFDGLLSTVMALIALGLNAAAYRRVARG